MADGGAPGGAAVRARGRRGRGRALIGALAVVALIAAVSALWQTQFGPLTHAARCWGAWPDEGGASLFDHGDRDRASDEVSPTPEAPRGRCTVTWSRGTGSAARQQRVRVGYGTGPKAEAARRSWLDGLFARGGDPLPGALPGFVGDGSGALVLPERCDVDGRPSVVTVGGARQGDGRAGVAGGGFARTGRLLVDLANHGMRRAGCAPERPLRMAAAPTASPAPSSSASPSEPCSLPGLLGRAETARGGLASISGGGRGDFRTCVVSQRGEPAAQFAMVARARLVALFDGAAGLARLPGDRIPLPDRRAYGRMDASGATVRADCAGRPAIYTMRTDRTTGTSLDDPSTVFPRFVTAASRAAGCPAAGGSSR
ncbi:hypothetical protein AB0A77_04975 [Streptomyces varsoviensis]|uniref:hypothetical protein n=1 Tax=Streptomyces varsoviensis TaxID=67373 RepID=UPI0033E5F2C3